MAFSSSLEGAMKLKFASFCSSDALSDGILFVLSQKFLFLAKNQGL